MNRGHLLPPGCKDLIDVINLESQYELKLPSIWPAPKASTAKPSLLLPAPEEIIVPECMTVRELANALKQKPFKIIADLMEFGVFTNVNQQLSFESIQRVARKYGCTAKRFIS